MIELTVNEKQVQVGAAETTPLLDVLRNELDLKGSRYGCGLEQCGSCMVLVDGEPVFACSREVGTVAGRSITTIEGLGGTHPLQLAFLEEQAGQCAYCLSGIIM
jgi:nicotinate dehydrogenase subunit A